MALTKVSGSVLKNPLSLSGNVSVGGTLTYEDVTNVDAIGIITARSDISIADKIIHTGDTNTAIRFPAADTFAVETGGFERFRVDATGDVLFGTTDDAIYNDSSGEGIVLRGGDCIDINRTGDSMLNLNRLGSDGQYINFRRDGSVKANLSSRDNTFCIDVNGYERLRVDTNGDVLFGTTDDTIYNNSSGEGVVIRNGDCIDIARNNDNQLFLNRQSGDGYHIAFLRDGSYKSFISTRSNAFCIDVAGSERLRINSTGQLLLGSGAIATPKVTQAGSLDLDSGGISLCIGGNENSNGRTNSTNKLNRIVTPHYTNAEEPMAMISGYSTSGASELFYGGGSGLTNAATSHHFYTASGTTTTTGTKRLFIRANGQIIVGEANVNPANDFEVRRANAGGDVSIRIGNNTSQDSGSTASLYLTTSPSQTFNTGYIQAARADGSMSFGYGTSENMRLSNDGNLSIRTTSAPNFDRSADYGLYIAGSTYQKAGMAIRVDANDDNPASIVLAKSRSSGDTIVGRYDDVGQLDFVANDGNGFHTIARVMGSMDGENSVPANNDMPGNLRFFTCEDGGTSLTERARIHSWGGLEISNCKLDYGSNEPSHSYFYTFHRQGTYNTFSVDIGFMMPGGYNLEMMMGGYGNRRMHNTQQGYVYNGGHFGSSGAIDSGNGPQRSWSNVSTYGSYGTKMRYQFTSMSSTHTCITMRLSFGPAGGTGRASRAEITDCSWS